MSSLHKTTGRRRLGAALALSAAILWGTLPVALKAVLSVMDASTVTWYRFLASSAVLTAALARRGALPRLPAPGEARFWLCAAAVAGFAGNGVLYLMGLNRVSPSAAQVLIQLAPVLFTVAAVMLFREPFAGAQLWGMGVLITGVGLFFHHRLRTFTLSGEFAAGAGLVAAAALIWVVFATAQKQLLRHYSSFSVMWIVYTFSLLLLAPLASPSQILGLDGAKWWFLLYCSLNSLLGYGAFAEALAHLEASRVSAIIASAPLLTALFTRLAAELWPAYVRPEQLDWTSLAGAALVVAGCAMIALWRPES